MLEIRKGAATVFGCLYPPQCSFDWSAWQEEKKVGDTASVWMCLLRIPGQQQSKSLAPCSVHFSPNFPLSLCASLFFTYSGTFSLPRCLSSFQLQTRKTPNQLASEPVSQSVGQSALQRALPIIVWFFSCCFALVFPLRNCLNVPQGGLNQYTF